MNETRHTSLASMSPSPNSPARRSFLDVLLGSTAVATLGAIFYPIFKFMTPPQIVESAENSVVAAKLSEVPPNSGKILKFGNKPGILVHTAAVDARASSDSQFVDRRGRQGSDPGTTNRR